MKVFYRILCLLLFTVCLVSKADATLISNDWKVAGDQLITRDTVSGLEWLDLSETVGNSILDTESDASVFGPFRWATEAEITSLLSSNLPYSINNYHSGTGTEYTATINFVNLLGATHGPYTGWGFVQGVSRGSPTSSKYGLGVVRYGVGPQYYAYGPLSDVMCCWDLTENSATVGSWLVRDTSPASTPIPEPSIMAMFALGLFGIGYTRC